jgi:hypothetical protein
VRDEDNDEQLKAQSSTRDLTEFEVVRDDDAD